MQRQSTIVRSQFAADVTEAQPAKAGGVVPPGPLRRLHHDEQGAQAVEYAMIAGLGAGFIGILYRLITSTGVFDRVVATLLEALLQLVTSWF